MRPLRILVTGSRDHEDYRLIWRVLGHEWRSRANHAGDLPPLTVAHGGNQGRGKAPGADQIAGLWAAAMARSGLPVTVETFEADWAGLGKKAGPVRNGEMVRAGADACLAFPLGSSVGTWDCVRRAQTAGIPVFVHKGGA